MVLHLQITTEYIKTSYMTKEEKQVYNKTNYGFLQIKREEYELLKKYCKEHGFIMGTFVSNLIRKEIKRSK